MVNRLLLEIQNLHELIEEKEGEHIALMNNGGDETALQHSKTYIHELRERLQALEHLFLDDSMSGI